MRRNGINAGLICCTLLFFWQNSLECSLDGFRCFNLFGFRCIMEQTTIFMLCGNLGNSFLYMACPTLVHLGSLSGVIGFHLRIRTCSQNCFFVIVPWSFKTHLVFENKSACFLPWVKNDIFRSEKAIMPSTTIRIPIFCRWPMSWSASLHLRPSPYLEFAKRMDDCSPNKWLHVIEYRTEPWLSPGLLFP